MLVNDANSPYFITLKSEPEYFFMAGVYREWKNIERQESADTFAIVTTRANTLMEQIHNTKKRMPVILPEALAFEWLQNGLSDQRINELATYQFNSNEMMAWPVAKKFLTIEEDSSRKFNYEQLTQIKF